MSQLGVAIVGCGRISDLHALGHERWPDAAIVAVCDTKRGRARAKAEARGVDKVYTDYQRLLEDDTVDLVELLVPHDLHAQMALMRVAPASTSPCRSRWPSRSPKRTG